MDLEINPAKVYEYLINEEETRTGKPTTKERKVEPEVAAQVDARLTDRTPRSRLLSGSGPSS